MITTKRKKHLDYRGETKVLKASPHNLGYGRKETVAPKYHFDNFFSIKNTYSRWTRYASDTPSANSYELSTCLEMLQLIWKKIRPEIDSPENDLWLDSIYAPQKEKLDREIRWGNTNGGDIVSYLCKEITKYYEDFDKETGKPLLLRIIMVAGD